MGEVSVGEPVSLRVVLVNCEGFLGDIIRHAVADAPDMDVVAELRSAEVGPATLSRDADLVLWNDADEHRIERFVAETGRRDVPPVLATLGDGRDAALWELVPRRTSLGSLSPASLVEAMRAAAADGAGEPA